MTDLNVLFLGQKRSDDKSKLFYLISFLSWMFGKKIIKKKYFYL